MLKEKIEEFADNNYYANINRTTKLTLKKGEVIYGFFVRHNESDSSQKMKSENRWDFIIVPNVHRPPKISVIDGDELLTIEEVDN